MIMKFHEKLTAMKAAYEKVQDLRLPKTSSHVASTLDEVVRDSIKEVTSNPHLSPEGKQAKIDEIKDRYGKEFVKMAGQMKDEYQRSVVTIKVGAELLLNEAPPKPSEVSIQTFQRELSALKTELLLATDANVSMESVKAFVDKQKDPYFAHQLKGEFPELASSIIGTSNNDQRVKIALRDVSGAINNKALLPEQREAAELSESVKDAFGANLFLENGIQMENIRRSIGDKYARYANTPELYRDPSETSAE
jgi:hypothetical protein